MSLEPTRIADDFTARADEFWRDRGGRMTVVREMICRVVGERGAAFVAEELWQEVRRIDPGISMASIYRSLTDLVEAGLLREIRGPSDQRSFVKTDSPTATSGHLICKDCHRIVPLDDGCLALREGAMIRSLGFDTAGMHLQIEAECESMKRSGTCEKRPSKIEKAPNSQR